MGHRRLIAGGIAGTVLAGALLAAPPAPKPTPAPSPTTAPSATPTPSAAPASAAAPEPPPAAAAAPAASPSSSAGQGEAPQPAASPTPTPPLPRVIRAVCTDHICGNCDGKCQRNGGHVAVDKKGHCACTPTEGSALDQATRQAYEKHQPR